MITYSTDSFNFLVVVPKGYLREMVVFQNPVIYKLNVVFFSNFFKILNPALLFVSKQIQSGDRRTSVAVRKCHFNLSC